MSAPVITNLYKAVDHLYNVLNGLTTGSAAHHLSDLDMDAAVALQDGLYAAAQGFRDSVRSVTAMVEQDYSQVAASLLNPGASSTTIASPVGQMCKALCERAKTIEQQCPDTGQAIVDWVAMAEQMNTWIDG